MCVMSHVTPLHFSTNRMQATNLVVDTIQYMKVYHLWLQWQHIKAEGCNFSNVTSLVLFLRLIELCHGMVVALRRIGGQFFLLPQHKICPFRDKNHAKNKVHLHGNTYNRVPCWPISFVTFLYGLIAICILQSTLLLLFGIMEVEYSTQRNSQY